VVFDGAGTRLGEAPIGFAPPPALALAPSSGLVDGQSLALTGTHLVPGAAYRVLHCRAFDCNAGRTVDAAGDGTLAVEVAALQRFTAGGRPVVCRTGCSVRVLRDAGGQQIERLAYAMATGSLSAAPDTGLADGEAVQVTGSELMASYAGAPILGFPTGGWMLAQCDRRLLDELSLGGALTHCAAAPTTRPVEVPGSSLTALLEVRATIPRILGGTTDCTAAPGACVVGLVRFEQDGSYSAHLVPVSFGTAG